MKVLYILNESPFYLQMAWYSISQIRKFNKEIKIEILFIHDNGRDNRFIGSLDKNALPIKIFDADSFVHQCKNFRVEFNHVYDLDMKEEIGFHSMQRIAFQNVEDDKILLLDADTFVFGDICHFFESLGNHDVVADLNAWGKYGNKIPYEGIKIDSLNSGVVLFNYGILREYGKQVYDLSMKIKGDDHYVGRWLTEYQKYEGTSGKLCREEIAFSLFLHENKIKYRLSDDKEIQTNNILCKTLIHHTQVQNYMKYWRKYYKNGCFVPFHNMKLKYFHFYL